jgi:hypothetical protein
MSSWGWDNQPEKKKDRLSPKQFLIKILLWLVFILALALSWHIIFSVGKS